MILLLLTLSTFAYAEEYQVEILDIGQDRGYQKCTHFVYFALDSNTARISDSTKLAKFDFSVVSVKTEDAVVPEDDVFKKSPEIETATIIKDPQNQDNHIGKATFEKHERDMYYHFRVIASKDKKQVATSEKQKAYIRSGFPESVVAFESELKEKISGLIIYVFLIVFGTIGLVAFIITFFRILSIAKNEKNTIKKDLDYIIKNWKHLADVDRKLAANSGEWDAKAITLYDKISNKIKKLIKKGEFPIIRILDSGLLNHRNNQCKVEASKEVDRAMENEAQLEHTMLCGKTFDLIQQMAICAPSIGLLGTVVGISFAFKHLPEALAKGQQIAEALAPQINLALVTTIIGLIIGIFLTLCHSTVSGMLKAIESRWQETILKISRDI